MEDNHGETTENLGWPVSERVLQRFKTRIATLRLHHAKCAISKNNAEGNRSVTQDEHEACQLKTPDESSTSAVLSDHELDEAPAPTRVATLRLHGPKYDLSKNNAEGNRSVTEDEHEACPLTPDESSTSAVLSHHELDEAPAPTPTNSVFLTKKMLGYGSDDSITSTDISEDEFVPESSVGSEDSYSSEELSVRKITKQRKEKDCGAKHQETLSFPKLRKQVSTLSKLLNLKDTEMDQLADFLGHDIRIHLKYYRLPEGTLQLEKISKILMACEQGRLSEFRGKSLEEISIEPNETVAVDPEAPKLNSSGTSDSEDNETETSGLCSSSRKKQKTPRRAGESGLSSSSEKNKRVIKGFPSTSETEKAGGNPGISDSSSPLHLKRAKCSQKVKTKKKRETGSPERGAANPPKRKWTRDEIDAVEKKMMKFICSAKTPGKNECVKCIEASPQALKRRDWRAVKFYVRNRIITDQRLST